MPREKKTQFIEKLKETFSESSAGILTDFRGITTSEMTALRRRLRESGIKYKVVKNTLARFAADGAGKGSVSGSFEGPMAIAFGFGDVAEPARVLTEYIRTSQSTLTIKGGFLGDRLLNPGEVTRLATLPSKEVLLAQMLAGMQSPVIRLVNCLGSPLIEIMGVLQARIKQLEGE